MINNTFDLDGFLRYIQSRPIAMVFRTMFELKHEDKPKSKETHIASVRADFTNFLTEDDRDWCAAFLEAHTEELADHILNAIVSLEQTGYVHDPQANGKIGLIQERALRDFAFNDELLTKIRHHNGIQVGMYLAIAASANAADVVYVPNQFMEYDILYHGEEGCLWLALENRAKKTDNRLSTSQILQLAEDAEKYMPELGKKLSEEESRYLETFPWNTNTSALAHIDGVLTKDTHPIVGDESYPFSVQRLEYALTTQASITVLQDGALRIDEKDISFDTPKQANIE